MKNTKTSKNVFSESEKTTLSENEIKVLMYMKDQKPHSTPPKGMGDDVFCVVCEMLTARKCVKELKDADPVMLWGESPSYHIMPKGYEIITMMEQEVKKKEEEAQQKEKEEEKKLDSIITDEELNMLFAEVLKKHPYFRNVSWSKSYWDTTKDSLKRLFFKERTTMAVYELANEMSIDTTRSYYWQGHGSVDQGDRNAYKLYVVIYYKYKDNPSYGFMLDALAPEMGTLGAVGRLDETNKLLDAVRKKYGTKEINEQDEKERLKKEIDDLKKKNEELKSQMPDLVYDSVTGGIYGERGNIPVNDDRVHEQKQDETSEEEKIENPRQKIIIAPKRATDVIKVLYALCECGVFEKEQEEKSVKADIKDVMNYFGCMFDSNTVKNYSSSLSGAKGKSKATFFQIIGDMEGVLKRYFSTKHS